MSSASRSIVRLCLASSALATAALCAPAARAAVFTRSDVVGVAPASQSLHFDVYLPLRNTDKLDALVAGQQDPKSALYHKWLTPAQFAAQFGPSKETVAAVARELASKGFAVTAQSRSVHAVGTADAVNRAFGTTLSTVRNEDGKLQSVALSGLKLSPTLVSAGAHIVAFAAHKSGMHVFSKRVTNALPANRYGADGGYWYNDLKQAYGYPAVNATVTTASGSTALYNGSGATIAALMSSDMEDGDVAAMFNHEQYSTTSGLRNPHATHIYIAGAVPNQQTGAFDEASLDIQQELGGAPGANVLLYDIPDLSDASIMGGYTYIDEANGTDVVSSSFGGCELGYTAAYNFGTDFTYIPMIEHELFVQGNAQGITFLASSGDEAGKECPTAAYYDYGQPGAFVTSVGLPAADPNVTAVGGTNLVTAYTPGSYDSTYVGENAYADPEIPYDVYGLGANVKGGLWGAGGGVSAIFAMPTYQMSVPSKATGRMVPDIGMQVGGCPGGISKLPCDGGNKAINGNGNTDRSYVLTVIAGGNYGLIGTSVSSPEFASVMALIVERVGRVGNINPYLYGQRVNQMKLDKANGGSSPFDVYHTAIPGYNGVVANNLNKAYNYTTGVGTPIVAALVGAPSGTPVAGVPRTPSNP